MKKSLRKIMGIALSAAMVMSPVMEVMAANQFNVEAEDVSGRVLFPGDSIAGIEPVYMGPDGNAQEVTEGKWTNNTSQAYVMSGIEGEEGGLWLEPAGYVLTVNGGTSKVSGTDGTDTFNHYKPKDGNEEETETSKDIAFYTAWTDVTVTAEAPEEGKVFDHWQVDNSAVSLEDAVSSEISFTMPEAEVVLTAVYADAPVEETPAETQEQLTEEGMMTELPEQGYADEAPEVPADDPAKEALPEGSDETTAEVGSPETSGSPEGDASEVIVIGEDNGGGELLQSNDTEAEQAPQTYTLIVENGTGSGEYSVGTEVAITAAQIEGMTFSEWTTDAITVWFADSTSESTTFSMPAESVTVKAVYTENQTEAEETPIMPDLHNVNVENGLGGGTYETGAVVTVYADEAPEGQVFDSWTISDNAVLNDAASEETYFVMPAEDVSLTANYRTAETLEDETWQENDVVNADGTEAQTEAATEAPTEAATEAPTEAPTEAVTEVQTEATVDEPEEVITEALTENTTESELNTPEDTKYRIDLSDTDVKVEGAETAEDGTLAALAGSRITITATERDDEVFQNWKITINGTTDTVPLEEDSENYLKASFIMPSSNIYIETFYEVLSNNEVQVVNGTGSGTYTEGEYVEISANEAPEGQRFKGWTVITGDVVLDDSTSASTGFTMPAEAVQVKAVYEVIKYTLTVNNGSGSGSYAKDETVSLTANYPASGKEFAEWKVTSGNASVTSVDRYYSSITMPAANVTVEATYKDGPSPDNNQIQGIEANGEYLKGTMITFTAVGSGMDNSNPNPGDYRYRPSAYTIGNVNGNWNDASYSTSMRINTVGQYTLTVTYSKDVFDGNNWTADGTTVTKSVTFNVVNALSVQTGDSSPIIPLIIVAVAALAVIIIILVIRKRRK